MYARILKFLTNLLFKQVFRGFLTPRKERVPRLSSLCQVCGWGFDAYNKRQRICRRPICTKVDRAKQYRTGLQRKRLEAKERATQEPFNQRFVGPTLESEE